MGRMTVRRLASCVGVVGGLGVMLDPSAAGATVRDLSRTDEVTYTDSQGRRITCILVSRQILDDDEQFVDVSTTIQPGPGCAGEARINVSYTDPEGQIETLAASGRQEVHAGIFPGVGADAQSFHSASFDGCGGCITQSYKLPK